MVNVIDTLLESNKNVLFIGAASVPVAAKAYVTACSKNNSIASQITLGELSNKILQLVDSGVVWCYVSSAHDLDEEIKQKFPIQVSVQGEKIIGIKKYREA